MMKMMLMMMTMMRVLMSTTMKITKRTQLYPARGDRTRIRPNMSKVKPVNHQKGTREGISSAQKATGCWISVP